MIEGRKSHGLVVTSYNDKPTLLAIGGEYNVGGDDNQRYNIWKKRNPRLFSWSPSNFPFLLNLETSQMGEKK